MKKYLELLFGDGKSFRITSQAFVIRLCGLGFIFLNQVLLARLMGEKGYGNYTVIFTWLNFLIVFSMIGFDTSVLRFFPSLTARNEWEKVKGFLRFTKRTVFVLSLIAATSLFLFLLFSSNRSIFRNISFSEAFFWAALLLPFLSFIHYYSSVLRALHKIKTSLLPFYIMLPCTSSLACWIYYKIQQHLLVDAAVFIYLCCAIFVCIFISRKLKRALPLNVRESQPRYESKRWLSVSVTIFVISIITIVLKRVDVLFISFYYGNTHAGIYAVASMISAFVPFGLTVVDYVFAPRISELYESHQYEKLQEMISSSSKIILIITVPIALIMILFGKFILGIFGTAFIASYLPLIILTAGQLVNARAGIVAAMMTMTGNHRLYLLIYIFAGILDVSMNFMLVPSLGMTGAAIASAVSLAALNLVMYFIMKKKLQAKAAGRF